MAKKKVNVQLTAPAVATDGNIIRISTDKTQANLVFFQVVEQTDDEVKASSVANVRLTVDALMRLRDAIDDAIANANQDKEK